jgi:GT2 family glycosyltransferase
MVKAPSGSDRDQTSPDATWLLADDDRPALQALDLGLAAWRKGHAALSDGDLVAARDWAERAARLGPDDTQVSFLLGLVLLRQRDAKAYPLFLALLERSDTLPVHSGLIAAARLTGMPTLLRDAVGATLSRFVAPTDPSFAPSAQQAATQAALPGWCAVDGEGALTVVGRQTVALALDDVATTARRRPDGRHQLPPGWRMARTLSVMADGAHFLGSPIDLTRRREVEGFVEMVDGELRGWAWRPADPGAAATVTVQAANGRFSALSIAPEGGASYPNMDGLTRPRAFAVSRAQLGKRAGLLHVRDAWGRDLTGSPLDPRQWTAAAAGISHMMAAATALHAAAPARRRAGLAVSMTVPIWADTPMPALVPPGGRAGRRLLPAVVIPVYRGLETTLLCLTRLLETVPQGTPLIVVDDSSPEPALSAALDDLARAKRIRLIRNPRNLGFPASANIGMRAAGQRDVLLLNSDALVPAGVIERLAAAARSAPDIGTVAPLSNDATILSYPRVNAVQPAPDRQTVARIDRLAAQVNGGEVVDIPTSVGFCMYIRRDCLTATGAFREDVFAQGYGEENDFCLRARHLGWRHVAAPGIFVGHVGGHSFRAARAHLLRRNLGILERLHPGYGALIAAYVARDPLAPARLRLDVARWRAAFRKPPAIKPLVILITHGEGGGVERQIKARCRDLGKAGFRPVILRPDGDGACLLEPGLPTGDLWRDDYPNLRFSIPDDIGSLAALLRRDRPDHLELHHQLGHPHAILGLAPRLGLPMDIYVHDYASICPRVTLVTVSKRYCGEPDHRVCEACVADLGSRLREDIAVVALRQRTAIDFSAARRVVVPSAEVAMRLRRYLPDLQAEVEPWGDDTHWPRARPRDRTRPGQSRRRVAIIGAIGVEKGYEIILGCARDAAQRDLPLEFVIVGYTRDDDRLVETGRVFVTYRFAQNRAVEEIAAQNADIAFIPSIWPETWCFALSDAWAAGLRAAVFDIGTQAERVRATGKGWVLPLALSPAGINNALLALPDASHQGPN